MRKTTRTANRRKWIVGSVMAFAGVALLTTAAATWIIGTNLGNDQGLNVKVDTVRNEGARFNTVTLSNNDIVLGETYGEAGSAGSGVIHNDVTDGGTYESDFTITFSSLNFTFGKDFVGEGEHLEIQFSIEYDYTAAGDETLSSTDKRHNVDNLIEAEGNKIGDSRTEDKTAKAGAESDSNDAWEYVAAPTDIAFASDAFKGLTESSTSVSNSTGLTSPHNFSFSKNDTNGTIIGSATDLSVNFSWGSFFGGMSPVAYYNSKFYNHGDANTAGKTEINAILEDGMYAELDAMHDALDSGVLVLTLRLASVAAA